MGTRTRTDPAPAGPTRSRAESVGLRSCSPAPRRRVRLSGGRPSRRDPRCQVPAAALRPETRPRADTRSVSSGGKRGPAFSLSSSSAVTVTHFCPHRRFGGAPAEEPAGAAAPPRRHPCPDRPSAGVETGPRVHGFSHSSTAECTGQLRVGRGCAWLWPLPSEWEPACATPAAR